MSNSARRDVRRFCVGAINVAWISAPLAQTEAEEANKRNNPLNLAASFNLQNYYTLSVFGTSAHTNDFSLRPTVPVGPNSPTSVSEMIRATVPISTRPDPAGIPQFTIFAGLNMTFGK